MWNNIMVHDLWPWQWSKRYDGSIQRFHYEDYTAWKALKALVKAGQEHDDIGEISSDNAAAINKENQRAGLKVRPYKKYPKPGTNTKLKMMSDPEQIEKDLAEAGLITPEQRGRFA